MRPLAYAMNHPNVPELVASEASRVLANLAVRHGNLSDGGLSIPATPQQGALAVTKEASSRTPSTEQSQASDSQATD